MTAGDPSDLLEDGPRTLASALHGRLRADILSCRLMPGERVHIAPIAKRYRVSLASVREAMSRLVADGLLVAEDQRGFRVSPVSLEDLRDLTETRIELDCVALRRSIEGNESEWRQGIERTWGALRAMADRKDGLSLDELSLAEQETWTELHEQFHTALVAGCRLAWLDRFRAVLYQQSERYRQFGLVLRTGTRVTTVENQEIVDATLALDAVKAQSLLAAHYQRTADIIEQAYERQAAAVLAEAS